MSDGDIWTGIACLKANPKVRNFRRFGEGKGAYVNVVAWVESQAAFEEKVKAAQRRYGLHLSRARRGATSGS